MRIQLVLVEFWSFSSISLPLTVIQVAVNKAQLPRYRINLLIVGYRTIESFVLKHVSLLLIRIQFLPFTVDKVQWLWLNLLISLLFNHDRLWLFLIISWSWQMLMEIQYWSSLMQLHVFSIGIKILIQLNIYIEIDNLSIKKLWVKYLIKSSQKESNFFKLCKLIEI